MLDVNETIVMIIKLEIETANKAVEKKRMKNKDRKLFFFEIYDYFFVKKLIKKRKIKIKMKMRTCYTKNTQLKGKKTIFKSPWKTKINKTYQRKNWNYF